MDARTAGAVLLLAWQPLQSAYVAERVTLKNGFYLTCDHQQAIGNSVRLYSDPGDQNYIEVNAGEIQSSITVPNVRQPAAANLTHQENERLSPAELHELMVQAGDKHDLDVDLLASVVHAESGGNPQAVSRAGAKGLMQLMPATAAELGVQNSFRPGQNIRGGTTYLDALLTRYHENLALALAAYNAGPAAVDRYDGVPPYPETRAYVARVIREFNRRKEAEMAKRAAVRSIR